MIVDFTLAYLSVTKLLANNPNGSFSHNTYLTVDASIIFGLNPAHQIDRPITLELVI